MKWEIGVFTAASRFSGDDETNWSYSGGGRDGGAGTMELEEEEEEEKEEDEEAVVCVFLLFWC